MSCTVCLDQDRIFDQGIEHRYQRGTQVEVPNETEICGRNGVKRHCKTAQREFKLRWFRARRGPRRKVDDAAEHFEIAVFGAWVQRRDHCAHPGPCLYQMLIGQSLQCMADGCAADPELCRQLVFMKQVLHVRICGADPQSQGVNDAFQT